MTDRLHSLERERERLETALAHDANWRAFRDAQQRRASGLPGGAVPKEIAIALSENELVVAYLQVVGNIAAARQARPEADTSDAAAADAPASDARDVPRSDANAEAAAFRTRVHVKAPVADEAVTAAEMPVTVEARSNSDASNASEASARPAAVRIDNSDRNRDHGDSDDHEDDLTGIRRIDRKLAARLRELGVRNFRQISSWTARDVYRVREALDLGPRISRENWIEQAALLSMRSSGRSPDHATARPTAPSVAHLNGRKADAPASVLTGVRARQPASAPASVPLGRPLQDERAVEAAAVPAVAMAGKAPWLDRADAMRVGRRAKRLPAPPARRFAYIRGVSDRMAEAIRAAGVQTLADIAGWTRADVRWFQAVLGDDARISEDGWIEQAQLLASGVWTRHALLVVSGATRTLVDRPQPLSARPVSAQVQADFEAPLMPAVDVGDPEPATLGVAAETVDRLPTEIVADGAAGVPEPRPLIDPAPPRPLVAVVAPDPVRAGVRSSLLVGNLRRPPPDLGVRWQQPAGDESVQRGSLPDMPAFMRRAFPDGNSAVAAPQAGDVRPDGRARRPGLRESLERAAFSTPSLMAPAVPSPDVAAADVPAADVSAMEPIAERVADPARPVFGARDAGSVDFALPADAIDPQILNVVDDWDDAEALVVVRSAPRSAGTIVESDKVRPVSEFPPRETALPSAPGWNDPSVVDLPSVSSAATGFNDAAGFAFASGDEAEVVIVAKPHAEIAAPQSLPSASAPPSRFEPQHASKKSLPSAGRIARLPNDAADDERTGYRDFVDEATVTIIRAEASERPAASIVPTEIANDAEAVGDAPPRPVGRKIGARFLKALTGD